MSLAEHWVICRHVGQLNSPSHCCCDSHAVRQVLQKVWRHFNIFGSLRSLNCSWHTQHSSSFLTSSKKLLLEAITLQNGPISNVRGWCRSSHIIVLWQFVAREGRKDRISIIIVVFQRSSMIVRTGKFNVSEQTKYYRDQSIQESFRYILRTPTSQLAFLVVKVFPQAAIRLSLTLQKRSIQPVRVRGVFRW